MSTYCMLVCLSAVEYPECAACYFESLGFADHQQGKFTLWSYPFHTQFLCISFTLKHCMIRFDNMWVLGSSWWGRNLLPCIQTLGVTITLCLYCHAMLVDVDWVWEIFMTDVRLLMVYLRWQLKLTSGWIEAPGEPSVACIFGYPGVPVWSSYGPPPRLKGIMRLFMLEISVCSRKLLWALA